VGQWEKGRFTDFLRNVALALEVDKARESVEIVETYGSITVHVHRGHKFLHEASPFPVRQEVKHAKGNF
jgi:hypothetical protein